MSHGQYMRHIRAKRRAISVTALKEKARLGRLKPTDRALVRVGTVNTRILVGVEDLTEWDEEELTRGRKRNKNGKFVGRDPVVVPKAIHDEMVKRMMKQARDILSENLVAAVTMLTVISTDSNVDAKDRLKAIEMIVDRTMGRAPTEVKIVGDAPWQKAIAAGIKSIKVLELGDQYKDNRDEGVDSDGEDDVVDAEVIN